MEVLELVRLSDWFDKNTEDVNPAYTQLVNVLKNNAHQPSQQPVAESLKALSRALVVMPTKELSILQLRVLEELAVAKLVGQRGRDWLNKTVRETTYDPATTFQSVQAAAQKIKEAQNKLKSFTNAVASLGFEDVTIIDTPTPYLINVIFQGDAAIKNVSDWKTSAADWELIIGGVAGVVNETPEEIAVVGTSNGSIIFTLSASPLVTKVLAAISKHIASIANDYLDFQLKRQELERSKMMTKVIRDDLSKQEKDRRKEGQAAIIEAVKQLVPNAKPETLEKLKKAVAKQISFSENGGEIDFVAPLALDPDDEDFDEDLSETVDEVRNLIEGYRSEQQKLQLLTHDDGEDEEDEDE